MTNMSSVIPKTKSHLQGWRSCDTATWFDVECVYGYFDYPVFLLPPDGYYYFDSPDSLIQWFGWGSGWEALVPRVSHRYYPIDLGPSGVKP
jgi:hypothetical protein